MKHPSTWNWDDLRYLLSAVRAGSCAAAAREQGVAVSTITRRLKGLQRTVGRPVVLFGSDGITLTPEGMRLMDEALAIERTIASMARRLSDDDALKGSVRVSAVGTIATDFLAPALAKFCSEYPGIELSLVGETQLVDILRGEADLIVRLGRPRHERLVCRRVAKIPMALYASDEYIARRGRPKNPAVSLTGHSLVTLVEEFDALAGNRWIAARSEGAQTVLRSNLTSLCAGAVRDGVGIGLLPEVMAQDLVLLHRPDDLPVDAIWIGYHEEMRHVPRIRATVDFLVSTLERAMVSLEDRRSVERAPDHVD